MQKELFELLNIADIFEEEGYESLPDEIRIIAGKLNDNFQNTQDSIDGIIKFQKDRLLDKQPFVFKVEVLHILEELLEMLGYESLYAREVAKKIFDEYFADKEPVEDEKLVDCFFDICTYSIGSIMKLKYEPKCVFKEGSKEINSRVGSIIDGKFVKDKSPEAVAKWHKASFDKCLKG